MDKTLALLLKDLKLIDKKLSSKRYATGDDFLSLLTFMGCSPDIALEPQNDKPYCYVEINSLDLPQFISGKNTQYPPCPHCKEKLESPKCKSCHTTIDFTKLNWRKSAFVSRSWITIGNIYELEAIPSDQLLNALKNKTGVRWKPAYIRHDYSSKPKQEQNQHGN